MLIMYAECLRNLKAVEDYVRICLIIIAKGVKIYPTVNPPRDDQEFENRILGKGLNASENVNICNVIAASETLEVDVSVPMLDYFDKIDLSRNIRHFPMHDGYELTLTLQSLLPEVFLAEVVRAKIVCVTGDQRSELWVCAESTSIIKPGIASYSLISRVRSCNNIP